MNFFIIKFLFINQNKNNLLINNIIIIIFNGIKHIN